MTTPSEGEKHFDIGWLAGIFDGEGSITFYNQKEIDRRRGNYIIRHSKHTRWVIVNTDTEIIKKSLEILTRLDIVAYVNQKSATKKQREGSFKYTKPCYEIIVSQRKSVQKIMELITPLLVSYKKQKSIFVLEYLHTHPFNAGRKTPRVTTERLAPNTNLQRFEALRMKLQSELMGNHERIAEMTIPAIKSV